MAERMNYTLGRGEIYFARFGDDGLEVPGPRVYIGNSTAFGFTISNETLDHYSSDRGVRQKDASVPLQVNRSGTLTTDNISNHNLALFFFGSASVQAVASAASVIETITTPVLGAFYQLGKSDVLPMGHRNITITSVTGPSSTPVYTLGDDYEVDLELGMISPLVDGDVATSMVVTYAVAASEMDLVISGSTPVSGELVYIAYNPEGKQIDYLFPKVTITPNGEFALKGDDWQALPFTVEILKKGDLEAIYSMGRAFAP